MYEDKTENFPHFYNKLKKYILFYTILHINVYVPKKEVLSDLAQVQICPQNLDTHMLTESRHTRFDFMVICYKKVFI